MLRSHFRAKGIIGGGQPLALHIREAAQIFPLAIEQIFRVFIVPLRTVGGIGIQNAFLRRDAERLSDQTR